VRKLLEIASSVEAVQDGRIHMEKVNAPSLLRDKDTRAECGAGPKLAIEGGRPSMHESGTFVKFTQAGADLLAQLERLTGSFRVSTGSGLSRIKGLGWAEG